MTRLEQRGAVAFAVVIFIALVIAVWGLLLAAAQHLSVDCWCDPLSRCVGEALDEFALRGLKNP